jgi:hypothetical protein
MTSEKAPDRERSLQAGVAWMTAADKRIDTSFSLNRRDPVWVG